MDASDDEQRCRTTAEGLQQDHPRWMVLYGVYTRQYIAFPLFDAPPGTISYCRRARGVGPAHAADEGTVLASLMSGERSMSASQPVHAPGVDDIAAMGRELGHELASLRKAAGPTQHRFAKLIGYARGTLAAVETGRFDLSRRFWKRCDDALGAQGLLVERYDEIKAHVAVR